MGKRTRYEPGTFCWTDLQTTDPENAKALYHELFGWKPDDMPVGDGTVYTMFTFEGDDVAALNEMNPEQRGAGVPPHWFSYISVENADEAAAKAEKLDECCMVWGCKKGAIPLPATRRRRWPAPTLPNASPRRKRP